MNGPTLGTGSELEIRLLKAFHAYRQGLLRRSQPRSLMPTRDFDALKFLGTVGWVNLGDRLKLRKLHIACSKGLVTARQGRLDESRNHYEQAKEHLDQFEDQRPAARLLGVSAYQAGVAYLDLRCGYVHRARERLDRAMDADLQLEQLGLPVMQLHRIQQGHNLARIEFRLGRREKAVELAGALLAYLEGRINELPYHGDWRPGSLQAVPRDLLQAMIHQIIGETAGYIVTGEAPAQAWRTLLQASRPHPDPEAAVFPQVQYALQAQHDCLMEDPHKYLRNLERFFGFGIRHCHLLWYAVMVELVRFCREADMRYSRQVRDMILQDSAKWKGLPPFLRDRLVDPPTQRSVA